MLSFAEMFENTPQAQTTQSLFDISLQVFAASLLLQDDHSKVAKTFQAIDDVLYNKIFGYMLKNNFDRFVKKPFPKFPLI